MRHSTQVQNLMEYQKKKSIIRFYHKKQSNRLTKHYSTNIYKNSYKIIYNCTKCHEKHKNIMSSDDNFDLIIKLSNIT